MFHNMKADIIYYKTATDFELEFNLCGCCRMRLLSDKMQDKKSFIHSLARAVSRSNVILIAGPLFGDEGTIKTVSSAINTTTELADNKTYGIAEEEPIHIIKGSIPLVTPEGYFGGCIIESGPQTMILLTDNKSIRKTIMQTLIHPYIEELYSNEAQPSQDQPDENDVESDAVEAPIETDIIEQTFDNENSEVTKDAENTEIIIDSDESAEATDDSDDYTDHQSDIIMDDNGYDDTDNSSYEDEVVDLYFEPTKPERKKIGKYYNSYDDNDDNEYDDDYKNTEPKPRKNGLSISVLIISIILLLVIAVLCYCIFIVPQQSGVTPVDNLQEIFTTLFA